MMKPIRTFGLVAAILLCAIVAVTVLFAPSGQEGPETNLANPSAVWCVEQGYSYEIRTEVDGSQFGVCILSDGTEQDAWEAYYAAHPEHPENHASLSPLELTRDDDGGDFLIRSGEAFRIILPENPSTGYQWNMTFPEEIVLQSEAFEPAPGSEGLVGAGGTRTWLVHIEATGIYQISGKYARPWEPDPVDTFSVTIEVV